MRFVALFVIVLAIIGMVTSEGKTPSNAGEKLKLAVEHLDKAVVLLKEAIKSVPAFGKPLERATMTIATISKAILNIATQYEKRSGGH